MARNIVILLDGTSNGIKANRTNILRLYGTLAKDEGQLVYYDPGVGTFGGDFAPLRLYRKALEIWGLATGYGLDFNSIEAYRFLVDNYRKDPLTGERDRIYIFGFSRGAYTARVLAGFINAFGLIEPRNLNLLTYAYRAYKSIGEGVDDMDAGDARFAEMFLYQRIVDPDHPPIRMLGLFDTVSSVIERTRRGVGLRSHAFTETNPSVQSVRHAVAIDERRTMFQPKLWKSGEDYFGNPFRQGAAQPQDVNEVWFSGVHGDIGGGYSEGSSQLAKLPLKWMIEQVAPLGLRFIEPTVRRLVMGEGGHYSEPHAKAPMHRSMTGLWPGLEFLPRRAPERTRRPALLGWTVPLFEHRMIPDGARLHQSVLERHDGQPPANLSGRHKVEPYGESISP